MYTLNVNVTPETPRSEIEQIITVLQSMLSNPLNQTTTVEFIASAHGFGKIKAIRILRELTGQGLAETKTQVDQNLSSTGPDYDTKWKWVIKYPYDIQAVVTLLKAQGCTILRVN